MKVLAGGAAMPFLSEGQTRKPNFLFLLADDMGWGDATINGRKDWDMPNVDRLAAQGTTFTHWYTACPVCAPSRAALMTGKYGIHNGVRNNSADLPKSEVTIAEALKLQGYTTALVGKWHKGKLPDGSFTHPLDQGFDTTFGYLDAISAWQHFPKTLFRGRQEVPVSGYSCDILAEESIKVIQQNRTKPFFLYTAFIEPHFLIEAPEEDVALYRGKFPEKDSAKPYNATYAAMIHRLDQAIGRILKGLEDAGLTENTIVVFTSDNGATFEKGNAGASNFHDSNRPFRGQKRSLEEGGIREPAIVRWPGKVAAGKTSEEIVHMTDVMPTFLAAAGARPEAAWKVDGANMLDVFTGRAKAPDRTLFWEWQIEGGNMFAALRGDYKLLVIGENYFLYNLRNDPQERRTVAQEYPEIFANLKKGLEAWKATEVMR